MAGENLNSERMVDETTPLKGQDENIALLEDRPNSNSDRHVSWERSLGELPVEDPDDNLSELREHRRHNRSESESSALEVVLESIAEVKEVIVETLEEVKDSIKEGFVEFNEVLEVSIQPVKPREEGEHSSKLGAVALAVLVFYKVSGGPFGCEPTVRAGGPFAAILGFIFFPLLWCIPEALVTAELGSAYPEPSGSIAWVEEAFGPQMGLVTGYFHWVSGVTDNAIYPTLFLKYLASYLRMEEIFANTAIRFTCACFISTFLSIVNWTGLEIVGQLSIAICILGLSPFVLLTIVAIPKIKPSRWFIMPQPGLVAEGAGNRWLPDFTLAGVQLRPYLNNLFWNLNSFDVGASFAGDLRDPGRVFPRAMFLSIILVVLGYLIPLVVALGATETKQEEWNAGFFTVVMTAIGGRMLGAFLVFAAGMSNVALYEAEMSGDAYQLMGMADRGLIPKLFTKRSRFGTPENGIFIGTVVIYALSIADFDDLVEMLNFAYAISLLVEFAAFIKLRITDADVHRPYKIPLNTFGCVIFVLPASLFLVYLTLVASNMTYIYFVALCVFGVVFHLLQKIFKHYKMLEYVEAPRRGKKQQQPI